MVLNIKYQENDSSLIPWSIAPATEKQIEYLEVLATKNGYYFNDDSLTKEKANSYINFFKNMDYVTEPDNFNLHFVKGI